MDLRHIIAYETMQKAFKRVLEAAPRVGDLDSGLRDQAPYLRRGTTLTVPGHPRTPDERTRLVDALDKARFNCRANFFIGKTMMSWRHRATVPALT